MNNQWSELAGLMKRFCACRCGAVAVEFTLIAAAMLIGIAIAMGDIGTSLLGGGNVAAGVL